ncbi:12008_t:CDS:2, partial [Acaulospora colombiana]
MTYLSSYLINRTAYRDDTTIGSGKRFMAKERCWISLQTCNMELSGRIRRPGTLPYYLALALHALLLKSNVYGPPLAPSCSVALLARCNYVLSNRDSGDLYPVVGNPAPKLSQNHRSRVIRSYDAENRLYESAPKKTTSSKKKMHPRPCTCPHYPSCLIRVVINRREPVDTRTGIWVGASPPAVKASCPDRNPLWAKLGKG